MGFKVRFHWNYAMKYEILVVYNGIDDALLRAMCSMT